ncbi:T9SS type A sorting domain-containing protein [Chryseobacterium sp.]|uniref:T9SS type A sorting domain-containing protein n=1 Tax=Chryseobacterium sp. TaxID=1871047 RepID=UPI000EE677C1|nr:T9SS type A sorting domain-containing protein [Chryseobacterium sp.]HCA06696.1 hypothetical protein [Chryseobacterium sp.]
MKRILSVLAIFSLASTSVSAQDGSLDLNFFNNGHGAHDPVYKILVAPDNKIYLSGSFLNISNNTPPVSRVARLNEDGTIDNTFNVGAATNTGSGVSNISLQHDGKLLITADFTPFSSIEGMRRFNADGSLDPTFNMGDIINSGPTSVIPLPNSKIIIGGSFTQVGGSGKNRLARLLPDGNIDNTFNIGSGANGTVSLVKVQSDGKIIVGGQFSSFNGVDKKRLVRLNPDGSIDNTFVTGDGPNATGGMRSSFIQPDGKIVICGTFTTFSGLNRNGVVRLNTDGSVDSTFSIGTGPKKNSGTAPEINSVTVQSDGKIVLVGYFDTFNNIARRTIVRLNPNGSVDTSFISPGATYDVATGGSDNGRLHTVAMHKNRILLGGYFVSYGGVQRGYFARLNNTSLTLSTQEQPASSASTIVSPNPARESVKIKSNAEIAKIQILSPEGRLVLEKDAQSKETEINIKSLTAGSYMIKLMKKNGSVESKKLIKE